MSSSTTQNFTPSGLKLLVKYIGHKHTLLGSLTEDELDFLKNMIALNEGMYHSILHIFNREKIPIIENSKIVRNPFLKGYYKYFDVKHELWGDKGLCPKAESAANMIAGHTPRYARVDPHYFNELQATSHSYNYRRIASFEVPWARYYYQSTILKKILAECTFRPCVVTHKNSNNETVIKGLYVRIEKDKVIKMLKEKGIYDKKVKDEVWGHNISLKLTFNNVSCDTFRNTSINKDMKQILTPIKLSNDDPLPALIVPKRIHHHHDGSIPLKRYQLYNVDWMVNLENALPDYSIELPKSVEIMPKVHYDHTTGIVYSTRQSSATFNPMGGGLFDEVGLGKTLTCITLIAHNTPSENIGCERLKTRVIASSEPTCEAMIKSGKRVKENGGKPVKCGRVIKQSKPTKANPTPTSKALLLKNKVCSMHGKNLKEDDDSKAEEPKTKKQKTEKEAPKVDSTGVDVPKKNERWMSRATLVVCPNQIPYQWVAQIKQYTKPRLEVFTVTNLHEARRLTYRDIINADVIITTIDCIERGTVTSDAADGNSDYTSCLKAINLDKNCPSFDLISWHRVIVDEMHRVTNKKYRLAGPRLFKIPSTYRWSVTGTPFNKDQLNYDVMVSWLYGDNDLHSDNRNRLFSKLQSDSEVLTSIFRRNTKKSTEHLVPIGGGESALEQHSKLWQKVSQTEIWLDLSKIERAMYNARKASKPYWAKDRDDEYLRQICCHPNLSAENSKIVYAVHNSRTATNGANRYATNANDVKRALLDHNRSLIDGMLKNDIPNRIDTCWRAQSRHLLDVKDKKNRMAYYSSVHQLKRCYFKLYQLRKSDRAYTDIYNQNTNPIVLLKCDSCFQDVKIENESIELHAGDCGHTFCKKCSKEKMKVPFVDINKYTQTSILDLTKGNGDGDYDDTGSDDNDDNKDNGRKKKKRKTTKKKKEYEKKIIEGYAKCGVCSKESGTDVHSATVGMLDVIKVDQSELMMDMHSDDTDTASSENVSDAESGHDSDNDSDSDTNGNDKDYIPEKFKQEMDCAIGLYGTKITHLVAYLKTFTAKPHNNRIIIFSQWDNLLQGIMETLKNFDLPAMMCKGNVFQKKKAIQNFKTNSYYKIILLSSKYAASGLDLIEANKVIFIDPIYGDFDTTKQIEDQAIGRAHRLGQSNPIEVVRFLIKDTIEEECYKDWQTAITNK